MILSTLPAAISSPEGSSMWITTPAPASDLPVVQNLPTNRSCLLHHPKFPIVRYFTNLPPTDTINSEKSSGGRMVRDRAHKARQSPAHFDWNPFRNSLLAPTPSGVITTDPLPCWHTSVPDLACPCPATGTDHGFVAPRCAPYRKEYFTR